jgi:hypothetical protein
MKAGWLPLNPASFIQGWTQDWILIDQILSLQYGRFYKTQRASNQTWDTATLLYSTRVLLLSLGRSRSMGRYGPMTL